VGNDSFVITYGPTDVVETTVINQVRFFPLSVPFCRSIYQPHTVHFDSTCRGLFPSSVFIFFFLHDMRVVSFQCETQLLPGTGTGYRLYLTLRTDPTVIVTSSNDTV
jgi:hypothetical protein